MSAVVWGDGEWTGQQELHRGLVRSQAKEQVGPRASADGGQRLRAVTPVGGAEVRVGRVAPVRARQVAQVRAGRVAATSEGGAAVGGAAVGGAAVGGASLRVLAAGPRPARAAAAAANRRRRTFFWRRLLAVSVIAVLGALAWDATDRLFLSAAPIGGAGCDGTLVQPQTIALASAGTAGRGAVTPLSELGLSGKGGTSCSQVYVARPGDTIWQIAVRLSGGGDPRPLADRLEAEIGGGTLQPGQSLNVP